VCCCSVLLQCVLGVDRVVEHPIVAVCVVGSDNSKVALLPALEREDQVVEMCSSAK